MDCRQLCTHLLRSLDDGFDAAWFPVARLFDKVFWIAVCQRGLPRGRQAGKGVQARPVGMVHLHAVGDGGAGPACQLAGLAHFDLRFCGLRLQQGTQVQAANAFGQWRANRMGI